MELKEELQRYIGKMVDRKRETITLLNEGNELLAKALLEFGSIRVPGIGKTLNAHDAMTHEGSSNKIQRLLDDGYSVVFREDDDAKFHEGFVIGLFLDDMGDACLRVFDTYDAKDRTIPLANAEYDSVPSLLEFVHRYAFLEKKD